MEITIESEHLAYWYLRFNGFLCAANFIVHPDFGGEQRTDVDIIGVRFPHRAELLNNSMKDDKPFCEIDKPYIIIAEVKKRECNLNGPWVLPERQNMQRVLRAIGAIPYDEIDQASESIYKTGVFSNSFYYISLCCFGESFNQVISDQLSLVPQKLWDEVLSFIYERFSLYHCQKASHGQWELRGRELWKCFDSSRTFAEFRGNVLIK